MADQQRPQTCIECKHWYWDSGEPDWSDITPGDNWESACRKGHWNSSGYDETEKSWREKLLRGKTCADFEQVKL